MNLIIFWGCISVIFYVYFGYFLLVLLISTLRKKDIQRDESFTPYVSLLIPAHNEESVIREKIENSLRLDYPKDRLEIIVVSDGSIDDTNKIVAEYQDKGVVLHAISERGGKIAAQEIVIPMLLGEIIVFSDANTMYYPDSIRKLVRNFADNTVGGVSGDVRLIAAGKSFDASEGLYYKYERFIQQNESKIWSLIGADGAMYAIRKELYVSPKLNAVSCDDVIPMAVAMAGYRVIYEPEAIAVEDSAPCWKVEFRRRVRMAAFGINKFLWDRSIPSIHQPWLLVEYLSHRLFRWITPFFFISLFVSNIFLLPVSKLYWVIFILQIGFYLFALIGMKLKVDRHIFGICFYFCLNNIGNIIGVIKGMIRMQGNLWKPTERVKGNKII
ncbi:MAG: glycosyltransferase family 2 protein [bacterium]|nr:glycosyltransferase family 2 protein [bacterium]